MGSLLQCAASVQLRLLAAHCEQEPMAAGCYFFTIFDLPVLESTCWVGAFAGVFGGFGVACFGF
jgi:hypothetical protein